MNKTLVINISNLKEFSTHTEEASILDVSGSIKDGNKILPSDFFDESIVYPLMLEKYRFFSENILNEKKRLAIKVNSLSVYWLSACAVKYHSRHWAKDFFLLLTILEQCQQKIEQNYTALVLVLPNATKSLQHVVEALLQQQKYNINTQLIFDNQAIYIPSIGAIVKGFFSQYKKIKQISSTPENVANAILFYSDKQRKNGSVAEMQHLFAENKKQLTALPYYWSTQQLPAVFLKKQPTYFQFLKLVIQTISAYLSSNKLHNAKINIGNNHQLTTHFLKNELKITLRKNIHLFIFQQWLINYFATLEEPSSLFFEDEFYEIGRTISAASKLYPKTTTYGMQHAHFSEMHTVYSIFDKELENGIPIPDHFITWGAMYNQLFLQHNSLPETYTKSLGNIAYIKHQKNTTTTTTLKNILWCLTTNECMDIEWACIKNVITKGSFTLNIRLHPLNHIKEQEVIHKLKGINFTFQNKGNIKEAIANNNLIISSAHSSTFLDALVAGKYCIRVTSRFWNGSINFDSEILRTVANALEFSKAVDFFKTTSLPINYKSNTLVTKDEEWNKFINNLQLFTKQFF